jgi:hypothetical protein
MTNWNYIGVSLGKKPVKINGHNVWEYDWEDTSENHITVKDPRYGQNHKMNVYKIFIDSGEEIKFAAGEFSNCVWGFYVPSEKNNQTTNN